MFVVEHTDIPEKEKHIKKYKSVVYTVDENGNYIAIPSYGIEPENFALKQEWDDIYEKIQLTRTAVQNKKLSPIAYFIETNQFTLKRLSYLTGIPKRKIKKHLKPSVFEKLEKKTLEIYAKVFRITTDDLLNPF